jgi:predicted glycosyltransferase
MNRRTPRLLLYSHNGVGLGHFTRQLRLAAAFRERRPDASLLLVTGSHAAAELNRPFGFDYVALPPIRKVDRDQTWEPREPGLSIAELIRVRSDLLRSTVRRFKPDLLIADHLPAGPYGELLGALDELDGCGGRAVAGFRDIIDEPEFVRTLWHQNGTFEVLREHYTAICVYGAPEVMDFRRSYGLVGELAERLHYVGYLGLGVGKRAAAGETLSPVVTASSGGGVDGGRLLAMFIDAAKALAPRLAGSRLVVGGPLLSEVELSDLRQRAIGSGIGVAHFLSGLDRRIADSDLVVTMPGYNTTCELLSSQARAIVVPRSGPSLEQRMRAAQLERWGRAIALEPTGLDHLAVARAIEGAMSGPEPSAPPVRLDGLERAVRLFEALAARTEPTVAVG